MVKIYTYQDLVAVGDDLDNRMNFIRTLISAHKNSEQYEDAVTAQEYKKRRNVTIMEYQKLLYTISGESVPDNYSANFKLRSNFFHRFVTQQVQFLLGNGVSLTDNSEKEKLGDDFDMRLQMLGEDALVDGVAFGFWNFDHLEVFRLTEFVPLWDEETGALSAGVRFWQIDPIKPLRATLYELDGYTEFIWRDGDGEIFHPKRQYILNVRESVADGSEILDGENYPSFPIIPLWGSTARQSELVGIREQIDAYDLIKSGFANDLDDASQIYWTIQNAGGMDDIDLVKFVERMKTVKAAVMDEEGARAEAHTMDVPFSAREALLERLRSDLYEDYMALDTKNIANGVVTATQIEASYELINSKADMYEFCVLDFLSNLFAIIGVESSPSFTRSIMINVSETIQVLLQTAQFLPQEYIMRKILETLGDGDKADELIEQLQADEFRRMTEEAGLDESGLGAEGDGQEA